MAGLALLDALGVTDATVGQAHAAGSAQECVIAAAEGTTGEALPAGRPATNNGANCTISTGRQRATAVGVSGYLLMGEKETAQPPPPLTGV